MASSIVEQPRGDQFFTAEQITRLTELMGRWRIARDSGTPFSATNQAELDALIAAELEAAVARSATLLAAVQVTNGA